MNNPDYTENNYREAIVKHQTELTEKYRIGKNNASDTVFFNSHFVQTIIQPKQSEIWSGSMTFEFFNTFPDKSRLTNFSRFQLIEQHCLNKGFNLEQVADLIAYYDALTQVWDYILTQNYFAINTAEVYSLLHSKWQDESLELSNDVYKKIQKAIESSLYNNNIQCYNNWANDIGGLYDYVFNRYPRVQKDSRGAGNFPIPRFIVFHKNVGAQDAEIILSRQKDYEKSLDPKKLSDTYTVLFLDEDTYFLKPDDTHFGLMFTIQMRLSDLKEIHIFLSYHLTSTFKNNIEVYKNFLESISVEFKKEIGDGLVLIVTRFCTELKPEKQQVEITKSELSNKEITLRKQVLAIKYLLDEIGMNNVDKIAIADFIKLITGKEANQNTKNGNIYKILKNPFPTSDKALIEDLSFISTNQCSKIQNGPINFFCIFMVYNFISKFL